MTSQTTTPPGAVLHLGGDAWAHPDLEPLLVPLDSVTPYPGNPRRGDQPAITASIRDHGLYAGVVAQRSTGHIVVGNHRRHGLVDLGADRLPVTFLDILKTGYWCTAESHMLLAYKVGTSRTSRLPGGMTDFYANGGFIRKAAELVRLHPDCVKVANRYGRVHYQIDYSQFKQRLIPVGAPDART